MRLIDACSTHLKPIVIFAVNTGMRRGEILKLTWDDIDFKRNFIKVVKTKNFKSRHIPINNTLRECIKDIHHSNESTYLFPSPKKGCPLKDVKKSFATACRIAGTSGCTFHTLRHTFASQIKP